jgi:hypothetical protein
VTHQQDLLDALMKAPRFGYRPPPHPLFVSHLLRASAPPPPPTTPTTATTEIVPKGLTAAPAPVAAAPAAVEDKELEVVQPEVDLLQVPVWQALLDVRVWRSRPWWLRVAASLVVKRLNR